MPWTGSDRGEATLLRDVLPAPPTTTREFGGEETLVLFAEVYDNNGRARRDPSYRIDLEARLHDMDGRVVQTVSERRSSRAETRPSGGHGFTLALPLDASPPGQCVLQVEARTFLFECGDRQQVRRFRSALLRTPHQRAGAF